MRSVKGLKWWQKALLGFLCVIFKLWCRTLRLQVDAGQLHHVQGLTLPYLLIFWHNALFCIPEARRRYLKTINIAGLVSASRDGAWLSTLFAWLNIRAIRGSSSFRGGIALKELMAALEEGYHLAITPDGPRGPCYDIKPGVVWLAEQTKAPLVLLQFEFHAAWRLNTWDQFYIPKPFSKIVITAKYFSDLEDLLTVSRTQDAALALKEALIENKGSSL